ncbi:MAG: aminodeoxychorismate synthase component I [Candidatus Sumerlaeia bacterium]|nr:aminodeoxychorismate synthase component I [Candidatus Sumerlaeia bacterium]
MKFAIFESYTNRHSDWNVFLQCPVEVVVARNPDEVLSAIRIAENAAQAGCWAVIMLSYESASAFDSSLKVKTLDDFPLAYIAIFKQASPPPIFRNLEEYKVSEWEPLISRSEYITALERIHEYLLNGDTYQVNYTFPLRCKFTGDSLHWYYDLCKQQRAGYCAYLDLGRFKILSISPELFLRKQNRMLITRPMKGTIMRGRWIEEDQLQKMKLTNCPKNRAENLMIVDLIRNDLGRISTFGSVQVTRLFEVERYESCWQMTSTIQSTCVPSLSLCDIFRSLFPSGSVTGAPKIKTMEIINQLEPFPRKVYTGAIGFLKPGGDCCFNVAIRTVLLDTVTDRATFGVGGGITVASSFTDEYSECFVKAAFLTKPKQEFQLLETIRLEAGEYFLLERHLNRLKSSAEYWGFVYQEEYIRNLLEHTRQKYPYGCWKLRLLLARNGDVEIQINRMPINVAGKIWRVTFSSAPVDINEPLLYHKTSARDLYNRIRQSHPNFDDVILWNENEEVTESTIANIVVNIKGELYTPPREAGLLAGTYRAELLARGVIKERPITKQELRQARSFILINALRKTIPAVLVE